MGIFDKFRRRVKKISDETNTEELTEIGQIKKIEQSTSKHNELKTIHTEYVKDEPINTTEDEWDQWEQENEIVPEEPWKKLSKKERKKLKKEAKKIKSHNKPKGSKVDLQMMRSTTGRQLVKVEQAPRGSTGVKEIKLEDGKNIEIDLGGGVVESGVRIIKEGKALNTIL